MYKSNTITALGQFTDAAFMSAAQKRNLLRAWLRFVKSGFEQRFFTKALYEHLISHCSFTANCDRGGFYDTYFQQPEATQRFLDQFDRSKGCLSVEYGGSWWLGGDHNEYHDINNAMVDAIQDLLPGLRHTLAARELEQAEGRLRSAQTQVDQLRARNQAKAASGNRSLPLPDHEVKP